MGQKIDRECPVCSTIYQADTTRLKHGRQTTCSRKCSYKFRAEKLATGETLTCPICGDSFWRTPAQIERAKYVNVCSLDCLYEGRSQGIIKREVTEPYDVKPESREAWRKAAARRRGELRKPPITWTCEMCGKECSLPRGKVTPTRQFRFCSHECANAANTGRNNAAWRGGHPRYYGRNWTRQRRKARKRDKYTCQDCGISETDLGKQLDVHHITRFGDFDSYKQANKLDNLISLCHTCHLVREWSDYPNLRV